MVFAAFTIGVQDFDSNRSEQFRQNHFIQVSFYCDVHNNGTGHWLQS